MRVNPTEGVLPAPATPNEPFRVLLVEDDEGDAYLVDQLLRDAEDAFSIVRVNTLAEARAKVSALFDCVLLDLGLPDARGVGVVNDVLRRAPELAVVVLTGWAERQAGRDAVAAGAQDYLVKGQVDGLSLGRALRYAIQRAAAESAGRRLLLAERRQQENERLAKGLLPVPVLLGDTTRIVTRYQPGGPEALLGGDFFDAVELPDGTLRLVIGDVCGHGPDEAAVGVALRISWRALVLAGTPPEQVLGGLERVLDSEPAPCPFVTVCDVEMPPDRRSMTLRLCGHPAPMLLSPGPRWLDDLPARLPLGLGGGPAFPGAQVELPPRWNLLLLTDGVYEGRGPGGRLDLDGLLALVQQADGPHVDPGELLDLLIGGAEAAHGDALPDDVALMWVGTGHDLG
jgi:serine phosphatase RsbU (regulator of sigma subunit)